MSILIFVVILLVLVLVHEFGHFFSAKKFGIRVDEFGFGFPPKLFSFKKGETEYSLNLLPIGGFVKIFGENPNEENINGPDASRSFVNKAKYKQAIVLAAGVFANFLLAWFLFSFGFMSGLPTSVGSEPKGYAIADARLTVISVLANSPAEVAGLKSGDKIISVQSESEAVFNINPDSLRSFIVSHPEKEIEFSYLRGKEEKMNIVKIVPSRDINGGDPAVGIAMDEIGTLKLPVFKAFWEGLVLDWFIVKSTVTGLYTLIVQGLQGNGSFSSITGPVGLIGIIGNAYQFGFVYLLSLGALISVNLAVINLIPFPALDGGRLLFLLIEKIKGSRLNPKIANTVNTIGFVILIILMLLITYHDVIKLI